MKVFGGVGDLMARQSRDIRIWRSHIAFSQKSPTKKRPPKKNSHITWLSSEASNLIPAYAVYRCGTLPQDSHITRLSSIFFIMIIFLRRGKECGAVVGEFFVDDVVEESGKERADRFTTRNTEGD